MSEFERSHASNGVLANAPNAPTGREARLWRVLVELSARVEEALATEKPRPLLPGCLENLVVEFDDAYTVYVEGMDRLPSEAQLLALQGVDRQLAAMVRAREAALWTEQALREDARWSEAQQLARGVIDAFAWPPRRLSLVSGGTLGAGAGPETSSGGVPNDAGTEH
jgi:hypothetical protein